MDEKQGNIGTYIVLSMYFRITLWYHGRRTGLEFNSITKNMWKRIIYIYIHNPIETYTYTTSLLTYK